MAERNLVLQLLITARDTASEVVGRVGAGVRGIGDAVSAALEPLRAFGGLMSAAIGLGGAKELADRADAYTRLTNSLKVATKSEEEYLTAREAVIGIAQRAHSDLETTASLYARINQNAAAMNINQEQVVNLTELISKGMQLGGGSAEEYAGATLQLTQAFGSGVLRGEEFNSVMEASPELMKRLAAGLGVAVGELRGLAEQGVLTSTIVSQALLSQKDAIDAAYGKATQTLEQAFTQLGSKVTLFVGQLNESTGASASAGAAIKFLAENLNVVAAALGGAFVASIAKSTTAMVGYVQASLAARVAARDQAVAAAAQAEANIAAAQGNVAAAQAAYNRALAEQRATQAQLAALESSVGLFASEEALTLARQQASAAASAATTATQRYAAAQAGLAALQTETAAATGLMSRAMGFLAGPGGLILLAVGAFAALLPMLSKSKTHTEDLTTSTESYADSLKKMSEQQLKGQQIRMDEAIDRQREAVEKATAAGWAYADYLDESTGMAVRVERNAQDLALAQENLANETAKLSALEEKRIALGGALAEAQNRQTNLTAKELAQLAAQQVAMSNLSGRAEDLAKQTQAVTDANQDRLQSEIDLAQTSGDLQKVEALTLQLAKEKATAAERQAQFDRVAAVAIQARVAAMEAEYQSYRQLTPVQTQALIDAKADAAAKEAQAKASAALAAQLQFQAEHTLKLHAATRELLALIEKETAEAAKNNAIKQTQIEASLALAKARGDEEETAKLVAEQSAQIVKNAKDEIAHTQEQIKQTDLLINRLYAEAAAKGGMTPEQQKYLQGMMDENAERKRAVASIEAKIPAMQREAQQAEIMAGPIGQLTRLYAEQAKEHQRSADASERYHDAQVQEAEGAVRLADIKGDEAAKEKALADLTDRRIEQAQAQAQSRAIEAADAENALSAKALELAADGELTKADQEQLAAMGAMVAAKRDAADAAQEHAEQMRGEAEAAKAAAAAQKAAAEAADAAKEHAEQLKAMGEITGGILTGWAKRLEALSPAARAAFDGFRDGADLANASLADLAEASRQTGDLLSQTVRVGGSGFVRWANDVAASALSIEQAFFDQKIAVQQAIDALDAYAEHGRFTAQTQQALALATQDTRATFDLLNDTDLSQLQEAIDTARGKMEELRAAAQAALEEAQRALLQEKGDQAGVLELERKQRELELQTQINEAKAAGDAKALGDLQTALELEQEIYDLKLRKIQQQDAQRAAPPPDNDPPRRASGAGNADAFNAPAKIFQLNLRGDGRDLKAFTFDDPDDFLSRAERAQRGAV